MRKTSKSDSTPKGQESKEMDPGVTERRVGAPRPNSSRVCWAIKTLCEEVWALFPETPVEYSNVDGRNTSRDVTFDITALDSEEQATFTTLLTMLGDPAYNEDPRIREVVTGDGQVLVSMHGNPRTQDRREPFGLADAYLILTEGDEDPFLPVHDLLAGNDPEGSR